MLKLTPLFVLLAVGTVWFTEIPAQSAQPQSDQPIAHDSEYYILEAQNGARWAADDKAVEAGMSEKSDEFKSLGSEIYQPAE